MALTLDLLRHGEAATAGPRGDRGRALTPAGEARLRDLAVRLHASGPGPGRAFAGPRVRAAQTARIVLSVWRPGLEIETLQALEPDTEPARVLIELAERGVAAGHVLLVGHLPLMDRLCGLLAGQTSGFGAGTLQRVEFDGALAAGEGRLAGRFDS